LAGVPVSGDVSLLVLAGGESVRMGVPKHMLPFFGGTILEFLLRRIGGLFPEVLLAGRDLVNPPPGVITVEDARPERCPLTGILSGMCASGNERVFVTGCDMPFLKPALVAALCSRRIPGAQVTVPVVRGHYEPLCAVYHRSVVPVIADYLDRGRRKATGFYREVAVDRVPEELIRSLDPGLRSLDNMNTPREYMRMAAASSWGSR
jgi:molybdopterin-guanine dinucleotide biosynthesis protein A